MDLLEKSRNTLELPAVLEMLAGEAVSEPAKAEALALVPSPSTARRSNGCSPRRAMQRT